MMLVSDQKRKKLNIKQLLQALTVSNILSRIDAVLPWLDGCVAMIGRLVCAYYRFDLK